MAVPRALFGACARRLHHLAPTGGVHVEHRDARRRRFARRRPNGIRDVVEFQVEENFISFGHQVPH